MKILYANRMALLLSKLPYRILTLKYGGHGLDASTPVAITRQYIQPLGRGEAGVKVESVTFAVSMRLVNELLLES